jgi:hypothetical protein
MRVSIWVEVAGNRHVNKYDVQKLIDTVSRAQLGIPDSEQVRIEDVLTILKEIQREVNRNGPNNHRF